MGLCVSKSDSGGSGDGGCGSRRKGGALCKSRYPDPPSFSSFLNCPAAAAAAVAASSSSSSSPLTPRASLRARNPGHVGSQGSGVKKLAVEGTRLNGVASVATADWSARESVFGKVTTRIVTSSAKQESVIKPGVEGTDEMARREISRNGLQRKIDVLELEEGTESLEHPTGLLSEKQFRGAKERASRCNGMILTHQSSRIVATSPVEGPRSNVNDQEMTSSLRVQLEQGLLIQRRPRREDTTLLCESAVSPDSPLPVVGSSKQLLGESKECALDRVPYKAASGKGKIGAEKEHIKRSPLKPLNSNVYSVHDIPIIIKMPPQTAINNPSLGAIDQSLALANAQLEFASDGSSKAERELVKSLPAVQHESSPPTTVCEADDQDGGLCKIADRKEALQLSAPMSTVAHENLEQVSGAMAQVAIDNQEASATKDCEQFSGDKLILEHQELLIEDASLPGCAAGSSPIVKDQVMSPSGPVTSEDSVLQCVEVNMPTDKVAVASTNLVVSSKILEEVNASHREGAEVGANVKSREILTQAADHCLEDKERSKMIDNYHNFTTELNCLIETPDGDEVSGDQTDFIEIVLKAESGGFQTRMAVHSDESAHKTNHQMVAGLYEGVEPRKIEGEMPEPYINSEMIPIEVGEDCHIQADAGKVTKHLENAIKEHELDVRHPEGAGDAERNLIVDSREIRICGFDAEDLQVEGQSAGVKHLQGVTEEPHHVSIEQQPTLQDEMEKETLPCEVLSIGTSAESKLENDAPLLRIPVITPNAPGCFTAGNEIPAALEQQDDTHCSSMHIAGVYVGSRESEVDARLQVSNDSVALQNLVEISDTGQLDSDAQASSTYSSEGSTEVSQIVKAFHEAEKLPEQSMASFAVICNAEDDNGASSDVTTYSPSGVHATHAFLKQTITSGKDSNNMDIVASLLHNEDNSGNEEAAVRCDHLNDYATEYIDVADPLGVLTPTPSTPQLSRNTSLDTSGASTSFQLTSQLLPVALTAEEIAEIWGEFGDSLAPYSTPSTP